MHVQQLTHLPTESDLEARIQGTIARIFPWIGSNSLRHQLRFSIKFGRANVMIDGRNASSAEARLDILVSDGETPLAILELKREGARLSDADEQQGLSYARLLQPSPPLVIVTNGDDTRLLASHNGAPLDSGIFGSEQLKNLISAASTVATGDLRRAVDTLLGQGGRLWVNAIRIATESMVADMCGAWNDYLQPFVRDFLIPRKATQEVLSNLRRKSGPRVTIIDGPPLAGKSSVIREVAELAARSDDLCVLLMETDQEGEGVFQRLANLFSVELGWPATSDDIRAWLRGASVREVGPRLVVAIDGSNVVGEQVRRDIEELISDQFGSELQILLGLDDSFTGSVMFNETRRKRTRIGRNAAVVTVGILDDDEFKSACQALAQLNMRFMPGAESSGEYRSPWLLRAIAAGVSIDPEISEDMVVALPPLLGLDLIANARHHFSDDDLRSGYRKLARCILMDAKDMSRPAHLALESMMIYVVRTATTKAEFDHGEIRAMRNAGVVRKTIHASGEDVIIARLPEAMAAELASTLAKELAGRVKSNIAKAAKWFLRTSARLPLGDVVAAQAVIDAAQLLEGIPLAFLNELLKDCPRQEKVSPGTRAAMYWPSIGTVSLRFNKDGSVVASAPGCMPLELDISPDERDEMSMQIGGQGWLVLSHLAGLQLLAVGDDGRFVGSATPALLLEIGSCPVPLRRPSVLEADHGSWTHHVPDQGKVVCHRSGIIEPITLALLNAIVQMDQQEADEWIANMMQRESFPLLARTDIALRQITRFADRERASWAHRVLDSNVKPAISRVFGAAHAH
ncbi:hypothetical protein AZSI13_34100 [Azospira sp. I13]|uniref:type I restriction endonuclease n=1 Tax=Azospira sp. I13 TaxID=1765050 RepID=UPI000D4A36C7|nr:type I restriction endonuclease [Azospira sp. I13]GBG04083.1 hypothetical protein AZSI13_34100 [Azospira sp. I13]